MRRQHIALFIATAMLLASCVKEPIETTSGTSEPGSPTRISLTLKPERLADQAADRMPTSKSVPSIGAFSPRTRTTPVDESLISDLHVLVFRADGAVVSNEHFGGLSLSGSAAQSVDINTITGNGMQIYVVANGDVNDDTSDTPLDTQLRGIATLDQLKELLVTVKDNGLSRTERLTMVGTITTNITKPHTTAITIPLHYLAAKVTLTLTDDTPDDVGITITGWDVVNIPKRTYLLERTSPNDDAVDGSNAGDYITTAGKYSFESPDPTNKKWAQSFYLFENRRGKRVDRADPTDPANKYDGMDVDDTNQRGKGWYAPAGATCVLVYGTYTKDGRTNQVVYKIFLGANPINDYNIERGKHYEYNVTIKGLNDINVDTNVEWGSASFSVDHSDNLVMDAHPDFRVFRIGGTSVDASTPAYATVEVFDADGISPASWLAVSPLNLYRHGIKQSSGSNQQFGSGEGVGSYVRARYNATPNAESTFDAATFAMTRRLTKIPFVQPAVYDYQNVIVYADALDTPDATRSGKVVITYYKGVDGSQEAGKLTYTVTQDGPIKISDDLAMERYEESAMLMHPGLSAGLQSTKTMQWGYTAEMLYADEALRYTNGNFLTANAVYGNVQARSGSGGGSGGGGGSDGNMDAPVWDGSAYSAYRPMWPHTGGAVIVPSSLSAADNVYFYPVLSAGTSPSAYFHPIFNSSAARYCHEKNRDTDGDGIISASETEWYLPSFADMWYIANNLPAGGSGGSGSSGSAVILSGTYWTATEESTTSARTFTFPAKTTAATVKSTRAQVRCVRGKGIAALPDATIKSTETDNTKINLPSTSGSAGAFNIADATGLTWTMSVSADATSWLKVATSATGSGAATSTTGIGAKALYAYAASANTSTTAARTGTLTLTRPGMPAAPAKIITVTQAKVIPPSTVTPTSITLQFLAGESAPFTIDNKDTGLEWTVTVSEDAQSWLQIAKNAIGDDNVSNCSGTADSTLYVYAAEKNTSTSKNLVGHVTFSREGQTDILITVTQKYTQAYRPPMHKGWAGSNIYWDPSYVNRDGTLGRLTFDAEPSIASGRKIGVTFLRGSLVAISLKGTYTTNSILYSPSGHTWSYTNIPRITPAKGQVDLNRSKLIELHDPKSDIGDICRLISDLGWAPDNNHRWRMPVGNEVPPKSTLTYNTPSATYPCNDASGQSACVRYVTLSPCGLVFPCSGFRDSKGTMDLRPCGRYAKIWCASEYANGSASASCSWILLATSVWSGAPDGMNAGYNDMTASVRCVRE